MKNRINQGRAINFVLSSLFGMLLLVSCSEAPFYEKVVSFKDSSWTLAQKPKFEVVIEDTTILYDFVVTLRTTTDYKYSNIWFFWTTKTPNGESVREPFELKTNNPDGSWIGKNSGTIVENQLHFRQRKMTPKGKYTFTLEQAVTDSKLDEVLDIGLKIEKVKVTE